MTPYRRPDAKTWTITVATLDEARPYLRVATGTRDKATADAMERMLRQLGKRGTRTHWVIDALLEKRLSVGEIYDAHLLGTLEALRTRLDDLDLDGLVPEWEGTLERARADGNLADETIRKYRAQVQVLRAGGLRRSQLTTPGLKVRLDAIGGSGTNRRRHAAAWISFLDHCVDAGALDANPLRAMKLPKSNKTRDRYAEWPHAMRVVHAMPVGAHRALAALRHGAGLEMQAALAMTRRDVDLATKVVWAHGQKNTHRDRQAIVLDVECWDLFATYVRQGGFLPEAPLFPLTHEAHRDAHAAACRVVRGEGVALREGYTLHAARHTFAVEMHRRGHEPKLIAGNLGHANEAMMKLYAKFRPRAEDLIRAAKRAQGGSPS